MFRDLSCWRDWQSWALWYWFPPQEVLNNLLYGCRYDGLTIRIQWQRSLWIWCQWSYLPLRQWCLIVCLKSRMKVELLFLSRIRWIQTLILICHLTNTCVASALSPPEDALQFHDVADHMVSTLNLSPLLWKCNILCPTFLVLLPGIRCCHLYWMVLLRLFGQSLLLLSLDLRKQTNCIGYLTRSFSYFYTNPVLHSVVVAVSSKPIQLLLKEKGKEIGFSFPLLLELRWLITRWWWTITSSICGENGIIRTGSARWYKETDKCNIDGTTKCEEACTQSFWLWPEHWHLLLPWGGMHDCVHLYWLQRVNVEDLPFQGYGIFNNKMDEPLEKLKETRSTAQSRRLYPTARRRPPTPSF